MCEKKILNSVDEILAALKERPVFAKIVEHSCDRFAEKCNCPAGEKPLIVRDAKMEKDHSEGVQHCVVGEIDEHGINFVMTHDPNPSGKGIVGRPMHLYLLVPMRPHARAGRADSYDPERDGY